MTTELLCAPPACGKTAACIQRIQALRADNPLANIRVVVPDRLQADYFLRRLAAAGGAIGISVGTFGGLYRDILQRAGRVVPLISEPLAHRLVQIGVEGACQEGELQHYLHICNLPGFHQSLAEAFAELKRAMVEPADLMAYTGSAPQQELARIYARYQERLQALGWADQEGYSWLAVEVLQTNPRLACCYNLLVVDGFDTFNAAQLEALSKLAEQVSAIVITLPWAPGSGRAVERRFVRSYDNLRQLLKPLVTELPPVPHLPADLGSIARSLFTQPAKKQLRADHIELLEARSQAEEAREALRWFKARVRRDQRITLSNCALFVPDMAAYRPLLHAAALEFGVPLKFSTADELVRSPALAALLNLIALPVLNYKTRPLFTALHSPFLTLGLEPHQVNQLEVISRVAQIVEGRDQWDETWQRLVPTQYNPQSDEIIEQNVRVPHGQEAAELQRALNNVFALLQPPDGAHPLRTWIAWLENLLEVTHFSAQAQAGDDKLAYDAFRELLRAMVASDLAVGEQMLPYGTLVSQLVTALKGAPLPEPPPSREDALLVGTMFQARGLRFSCVALLGLSEGIFPQIERPDPLLDEELRRALNLEPRLGREQAGLFYQALSRADTRLLLTRPYLAEGGEDWEESPYWLAVRELLPEAAVRRVRPDDPQPLVDAASSQELLFRGARRCDIGGYHEFDEHFARLRLASEVLRSRRSAKPSGSYEGDVSWLADAINRQFPAEHSWSASRLETWSTCPFFFYVGSALELEPCEPPEVGYNAAQLGSMLHKILELTFKGATDPTNLDDVRASLQAAASQVFADAPHQYGFRPGRLWQYQCRQWTAVLEESLASLAEVSNGWLPEAFECAFGFAGAPPLHVPLESGTACFHGYIDRVDRGPDGSIRVIDYKTGSAHLAPSDLLSGRRLQLPLYALAARDALHLGEPAEGFYWYIQEGTKYMSLNKFQSQYGNGVQGALQVLLMHLERILSGIHSARFSPAPPRGGCPEYCPAARWCWRCRPERKSR